MTGDGPFLWLSPHGSPWGYHKLPPGGMCLSAFVFLTRGHELLLGKYADHPAWENLAGLDEKRRQVHGQGWTVPASHLTFGEDPREAGARVVRDILQLEGITLCEPVVRTEHADRDPRPGLPAITDHYDVWFFLEADVGEGLEVEAPAWYRELAFVDPATLATEDYGRQHEDVVAAWGAGRG